MRVLRVASWLLLTVILAQAASAQVGDVMRKAQKNTERARKVADITTPWTPEYEEAIGQASAAKLINVFGLYENPEMVKYVNLVGNTVARQGARPAPYRFAILDTEVITAVSLPGGYIFITRGALANIHSESELAGTLAHEVAHVDRRHLEQEVRAKKAGQFAKEEAAAAVPTGALLINLAGQVVTDALTMQISRDKESEADRLGTDLAAKAGYDTGGLRNFLQFLAQVPENPENKRRLGLWGSTHPPISQRVTSLNALTAKYPQGGKELPDRYYWYVNPVSFARNVPATGPAPGAPATTGASGAAAGGELDGVVEEGVIVFKGRLAEGTKVKVRVVPQ
jgi:predicted Zn-dependent protease